MFKDILNEIYIMFFSDIYDDNENYRIFDEIFEEQLKTEQLKQQIKQEILVELQKD